MKRSFIFKWTPSVILFLIIVIIGYIFFNMCKNSSQNIETLTDNWIEAVTIENDPEKVANLFCKDGSLVGTVSRELRNKESIKRYFDFFAKLPGIQVVSKNYNISKITSNVYINTTFITWKWDGLDQPIVARMSFIFRDNCIFQLHSSSLPDLNKYLLSISGEK
jgi:uncharacterized protein (TIGR02246 family)